MNILKLNRLKLIKVENTMTKTNLSFILGISIIVMSLI